MLVCREDLELFTKEIGKSLYLIDLSTRKFRNLIASYVLKGEKTMIVETGPTSSVPALLSGIEELYVEPQDVDYVALTHIHIDHGGGAGTLLRTLPNAKIIVHPKGAPHLVNPLELWSASQKTLGKVAELFGKPESVPEDRVLTASDGTIYDLGKGLQVKAIEAPGHASHNMGFYERLNEAFFPGDAAGGRSPAAAQAHARCGSGGTRAAGACSATGRRRSRAPCRSAAAAIA